MAGKIFVNYRRDDVPAVAARVRDRLTGVFGTANVFMDVDNLLAGQRFDKELQRALAQTDVFLAVIGPKWMELLRRRLASGELDYVRQEIAAALKRGTVVIPVLAERVPMPRGADLPADIRDLALHQKHEISHEHFGRDFDELVIAINAGDEAIGGEAALGLGRGRRVPWGWIGATAAVALVAGAVGAYQAGLLATVSRSPAVGSVSPRLEPGPVASKGSGGDDRIGAQIKQLEDVRARTASVQPQQAPGAGPTFRDCDTGCPEMVVVPAGEFMMGSPSFEPGRDSDEGPQHRVIISQPFAVGKFEVTFAEWEACAADGGCASNPNPSDQDWGRGRRPVVNVSWHDAQEYVAWLSHKTRKRYRLLSEAEWEYAARAGTSTRFAFGNTLTQSQARFSTGEAGGAGSTVEVGSFAPNAFGLHDMHGNVSEWVEDSGHPSYQGAPTDGSARTGGPKSRVLRGGSWNDPERGLRSAFRLRDRPDYSVGIVGFRVARSL